MHDEDKEYPERDEDDADDGDPERTGATDWATASVSLSSTSSTVMGLSRTGSLLYINLQIGMQNLDSHWLSQTSIGVTEIVNYCYRP